MLPTITNTPARNSVDSQSYARSVPPIGPPRTSFFQATERAPKSTQIPPAAYENSSSTSEVAASSRISSTSSTVGVHDRTRSTGIRSISWRSFRNSRKRNTNEASAPISTAKKIPGLPW